MAASSSWTLASRRRLAVCHTFGGGELELIFSVWTLDIAEGSPMCSQHPDWSMRHAGSDPLAGLCPYKLGFEGNGTSDDDCVFGEYPHQ